MSQQSYNESASLYLIPTPVGNMDDITLRTIEVLKFVDIILCEDTRVAGQLLNRLKIKKKLLSSNEQNEVKNIDYVISMLEKGKNIGLVTDRGTPIISDPGYKIVEKIIENGYNVIPLPGATAFVPALIASGINPSPFVFYGFLNSKNTKRLKELQLLKNLNYTIIFYEAPHRILKTLMDIKVILGNRKISVAREISKLYEEFYRGSVDEIYEELSKTQIKGEFVIVVEGNTKEFDFANLTIKEHVELYLEDGLNEKEALKKVAQERKVSKSDIYKEYHIRR